MLHQVETRLKGNHSLPLRSLKISDSEYCLNPDNQGRQERLLEDLSPSDRRREQAGLIYDVCSNASAPRLRRMTITGRAQAPVFRHGVSEPLQLKWLAQTGFAGPNETIPEGRVGSDVVEMSEASNKALNRNRRGRFE